MISKRIGIKAKNDHYARLAAYIADAGHKGEKCLMSWCVGCLGGEDYADGIAEVVDTQALNTRAKNAKTYHLVVSFRPEDEARLTPELLKAMEERFATALGYAEHQRHCGVHKNTGNLHMHVAYNMIHPEKLTWHKEFRDFRIRDAVCRDLEREYGLTIDKGREQATTRGVPEKLSPAAATVEAHSGQQSFESYAKEHKDAMVHALKAVADWQALHQTFARHGMELRLHANGLVVKNRHGKQAIKASALDRSLSLKKLEARFGPYVPPQHIERVQEVSRYQAAPLHRSPERGELYTRYQAGIEIRKTRLQGVKEQEDAALAAIRAEWAAKRRELERKNIAKKNLRRLLQLARKHEAEALAKARLAMQPEREAVRREVPFTSWSGFLRHEAEQGNEIALAVLRSLTEAIQPEQAQELTQGQARDTAPPVKDWSRHGLDYATPAAIKADFATQQRAALENTALTGKGKNTLLAVLRMEQLAAEEQTRSVKTQSPSVFTGITHRIDNTGTVIFTLSNGGTVRDDGKEVLFSAHDKVAGEAARQYAVKKWGKAVRIEGNRLWRGAMPERSVEAERIQSNEPEKKRGMER